MRAALVAVVVALLGADPQPAEPPSEAPPSAPSQDQVAAAKVAFGEVYRVLLSPRCMNCHPAGDRPLQTDASRPHRMEVSRLSARNGLLCAACHQRRNSEALGVPGGPPGAPKWHLPSSGMPLIFEGRTPARLCEQLKEPGQNGGRTLADLLTHVTGDPLVLWGWQPGGDRTIPPVSHAAFVTAFATWAGAGGPCPD